MKHWIFILVAILFVGPYFVQAESYITTQRTENFDSDPGWDGLHNRITEANPPVKTQDYGYSATNHAGEAAGEIGGTFWSATVPSRYAKIIEVKTLNDALSCSGTLSLDHATVTSKWQNSSAMWFGWFNEAEQGWRPHNFIGFRMTATNEPDGAMIEINYGTSHWTAGGHLIRDPSEVPIRIAPDLAHHPFEFRYDPGESGQDGTMTFILDGETYTWPVTAFHKGHGGTFNRFGIFNNQLPGFDFEVYFDDLTIDGEEEDFSTDPGWEGVGNRDTFTDYDGYGTNDFGYSATSYCGGETPGELGGKIWHVEENEYEGYYGDDDIGELTLDDYLYASGKFTPDLFSIDSHWLFGWFNSQERGWPPKNFVGIYADTYSSHGRLWQAIYGTSAGNVAPQGGAVWFMPDGEIHTWSIEYNPAANDGTGEVNITFDGQTASKVLAVGDRAVGATMNRFGMITGQANNGKRSLVYFDDIEYTVQAVLGSRDWLIFE